MISAHDTHGQITLNQSNMNTSLLHDHIIVKSCVFITNINTNIKDILVLI